MQSRKAAWGALLLSVVLTGGLAACSSGEQPAAENDVADEVPVPPRVTQLTDSFESAYALASAILDRIQGDDLAALSTYGVSESEWYHIVWPELPASQPGRNLPWDYAWRDLHQKSENAIRQTVADFRGREFQLVRVEYAGETTEYDSFQVHRDARCVVQNEQGEIVTLDLFGSVIERNGRFKAFSYVVD